MRKALAVCLLLIYTITSSGVFADLHFCGSKITGVSWFSAAEDCECKDVRKADCCSDVKIETGKDLQQSILKTFPRIAFDRMVWVNEYHHFEDLFQCVTFTPHVNPNKGFKPPALEIVQVLRI